MKVSYRGIQQAFPSKLQEKLDVKFGKLSKLLEKRGEKEAHVVVTNERHLHHAEITLQFYDHQLVSIGSDADLFTAISGALEKLEKQAVKQRTKWREKARRSEGGAPAPEPEALQPSRNGTASATPHVFRVNHKGRQKPMTLDEALIEMEDGREYLAYRDADRECLSVLVRRRDGHFDLVEP